MQKSSAVHSVSLVEKASWFRVAALCCAVFFLLSCSTPTGIVVVVDTDFRVPDEVDRIRVRITNETGVPFPAESLFTLTRGEESQGRVRVPFSFVLTPGSLPNNSVAHFTAEALSSSGQVRVQRSATVQYLPGQYGYVALFLPRGCEGMRCSSGQTCGESGCASPSLTPLPVSPGNELQRYGANPIRPTVTAMDGGADVPSMDATLTDTVIADVIESDAVGDVPCETLRVPTIPESLIQDPPGPDLIFVVRRVTFGFANDAWRTIGFDRDGVDTREEIRERPCRRPSCRENVGGLITNDGEMGIDNGATPYLIRARPFRDSNGQTIEDPDVNFNEEITSGRTSVALRIRGFGDPNDYSVELDWIPVTHGHPAMDDSLPPRFDGRDFWHLNRNLAYQTGTSILEVRSDRAFVSNGTLVASLRESSKIRFLIQNFALVTTISGGRIVGPLSATSAGPFVVSGWWPAQDAPGDLAAAGLLCGTRPGDPIVTLISSTSDIHAGGDYTGRAQCNALSIAFRLEMVPAFLGPEESGPSLNGRCVSTDAGTDAAVPDARADAGRADAAMDP